MQKYFEKLKERLEENQEITFFMDGRPPRQVITYDDAIEIVDQVAEEYAKTQLTEDNSTDNSTGSSSEMPNKSDGWIACSSGEMPKAHNEVWITYKWDDGSIHVGRDRVIHGEWHCTKREAIIAWKYMKTPTPYQPKGE